MTTKQTEQRFVQTWELDSILPHPDTPAFGVALEKFKADLASLADDSDKLPPVAASSAASGKWGEFLQRYEKVASTASDLSSFVSCHAAADAENKRFQQLEGVLSSFEPNKERIATNVDLALRDVDPATLDRFAAGNPTLAESAFFLKDRRLRARLRLPKDMENLAADLAVDGIHGWGRLYDRISARFASA